MSAARNSAIDPEQHADDDRDDRVELRTRPGDHRDAGDEQRQHDAEQRDRVLEQHREHRHVVAVAGEAGEPADLPERDDERPRLERQREAAGARAQAA